MMTNEMIELDQQGADWSYSGINKSPQLWKWVIHVCQYECGQYDGTESSGKVDNNDNDNDNDNDYK